MSRRDGQIVARGERKWLVRWYTGREDSGRRRYSSKTIHGTKKNAQAYLNAVLRSRDMGTYVEPSRESLDKFLTRWLDSAASGRVTPRTLEGYRKLLKRYVRPELGAHRVDQIRLLDVQELVGKLAARGLGPKTIRLAIGTLRTALNQAVRWGVLVVNPATLVEMPRRRAPEMQALEGDQVRALRAALASSPHAVLFDFMLGTGCRPGEALGLRWQDVDLERAAATIAQALTNDDEGKPIFGDPKTAGSRRVIPLPESLVPALRAHRARQAEHAIALGEVYDRALDLVFGNELGGALELRNLVQRHFKPALARAGLPRTLRLYDLRHTHATMLLELGVHPKVVAERLGHASTRMTMDVYSHVLPGMQDDAARLIDERAFSR